MKHKQNNGFPDTVIKVDILSRTKTVLVIYRNNLLFDLFSKTHEGKFTYSEILTYKNVIVHLSVEISASDFSDWLTNTKSFKLQGSKNHFGIFARIDINKFPGTICGNTETLSYKISFSGNPDKLVLESQRRRTALRAARKKKKLLGTIEINSGYKKSPCDIPSSVKWSVRHPFSGGRFSPK